MNRRSFIAACCGAAVAPWVKVKAEPLGRPPVGIGPFRPDKTFTHWCIDWGCDKCMRWETRCGKAVVPFPKGPIEALPCRRCGDMLEPVVTWYWIGANGKKLRSAEVKFDSITKEIMA